MFRTTVQEAVDGVAEKVSADAREHVDSIRSDIQGGALLIAGALLTGLLVIALVLAFGEE
jgi:hypothetical protein